jgi:putative endonuclease
MEKSWYVYILRCKDDTLYCGITPDLEKRLQQHNAGKGAKYTRGRGPLELVYREMVETHSDALKREIAIKRLSRTEKLELIGTYKTAAE